MMKKNVRRENLMSSANYGRSRHIANAGILGHKGHGKTTLTAAITKLIKLAFPILSCS